MKRYNITFSDNKIAQVLVLEDSTIEQEIAKWPLPLKHQVNPMQWDSEFYEITIINTEEVND